MDRNQSTGHHRGGQEGLPWAAGREMSELDCWVGRKLERRLPSHRGVLVEDRQAATPSAFQPTLCPASTEALCPPLPQLFSQL